MQKVEVMGREGLFVAYQRRLSTLPMLQGSLSSEISETLSSEGCHNQRGFLDIDAKIGWENRAHYMPSSYEKASHYLGTITCAEDQPRAWE